MAADAVRTVTAALATLAAVHAAPALGAPQAVGDPPRTELLLVLTPRAAWSESCVALAFGSAGDRSLVDRCRLLEVMADDIRAVAAGADLGGAVVLDRGETLRRVNRMRRPPSCPTPQACDLDTARLLAVDEFVSARASIAGGDWSVTLELRRVSSGRLVASAAATGRGASDLRTSLRAATRRLLRLGVADLRAK